jgi:uncharacterized membrane protein
VALLIALHVLAAGVWVGGMFFAYIVLRPSAGPLPLEARLKLWHRVFHRFFPWVWASVVLLLVSGYGMIFLYLGGFAGAGLYIHIMQGVGIVMMLLFLHLFFAPWRRFSAAVERDAFPEAAIQLGQIRRIVAVNLVLGFATIIVGASGRFW